MSIGEDTRVWPLARVLPGAEIGRDCNICDYVFIENDVVIGDRVTVKCGVQLWDSVRLEDDVFVGPNATFTNDPFPRSGVHLREYQRTRVCRGASIGANATILPGLTIGEDAMVGAGAVVTADVSTGSTVVGNPARPLTAKPSRPALMPLVTAADDRGDIAVTEFAGLPFHPERAFLVSGVPSGRIRGAHAHYRCEQFLVAASGSLHCSVTDGTALTDYTLDKPGVGLYLPVLHWAEQHHFSPDAVLLVLASHPYDRSDYITSYDKFLSVASA